MHNFRNQPGGDDGSKAGRQVNTLLHTLRGEHFRHSQNVRRSTIKSPSFSKINTPTLPFSQIYGAAPSQEDDDVRPVQPAPFRAPGQPGHRPRRPVTLIEGTLTYNYPDSAIPGPRPPKSWSPLFIDAHEKTLDSQWRLDALSILLSSLPNAPPSTTLNYLHSLTLTCMRVLLEQCESAQDVSDIITMYASPHLRRDLMRWCAINEPLGTAKLYALCGDLGHAEGELWVVGPHANLRVDKGKRRAKTSSHSAHIEGNGSEEDEVDEGWDVEDWDAPTPPDAPPALTVLVVVSIVVSNSTLLSFPPTLTHLALVALPAPTPVHRLPHVCPLLQILDLSYNTWLSTDDNSGTSGDAESILERVQWSRWSELQVLGLRECNVSRDIVKKVNKGRWTDVQVIGVGSDNDIVSISTQTQRLQLNP